MVRWPWRALAWLMRARLPIFTALIIILVLITLLYHWQTEPAVRLSGLLLQVLGITAAAIGIRDTRRMFGKPSFLKQVRNWFRIVPGLRPRTTSGSASAAVPISVSAKGNEWRGAGDDPTLESRLSAAESNLEKLRKRIDASESAFDAHVRNYKQQLREEMYSRKKGDRQLQLKIEAASTDGLHLAAVGVVWLVCGVVMSTAPSELLCLVS